MDNFPAMTKNICRICLGENNEATQSVFDTIDSTGELEQFSEMLMTCAKVKIFAGDGLPNQICSICAKKTIELYSFKIKCEDSDRILRKRLKQLPSVVIEKIDIDEEDFSDKYRSEEEEDMIEASEASDCEQIESPQDIIEVYEDYDDCSYIPRYSKHLNGVTLDEALLTVEKSLECDLSPENFLLHLEKLAGIADKIKMIDPKFDCERDEINEDNFSRSSDYTKNLHKRKLKIIASRKNLVDCSKCKMKFSRSLTLTTHKCMGHTRRKYNKRKKFTQSSALTTYRGTHTDEPQRPYECDLCDKKFTRANLLEYHKNAHTGEKPYVCNVCGKAFSGLTNLTRHQSRTHTHVRKYPCDICEKEFKQAEGLKTHKLIHTGEKPHKCDVCEKRFRQIGTLVIHRRTHTGEKPYECDVCERAFYVLAALVNHKRIHSGEKQYKCNVCDKKFTNPRAAGFHKRTHTGETI